MYPDDRWLLPEGIDELLPSEAEALESLRRRILDLFFVWGYRLVVPPFIEFLDSLLIGTGDDLDLQTFKLIDQVSGRSLGIRADITPQVARIDARRTHGDGPARFCYAGTVLRTQSDHLEHSRAPLQLGAELYGHGGIASDLEVIELMLATLSVAGVPNVHLDLGHVGIYRGLASLGGLTPEQETQVFASLQRKDMTELGAFLGDLDIPPSVRQMLLALPMLNGPAEGFGDAVAALKDAGGAVKSALEEFGQLLEGAGKIANGLPIHFDLAELSGYHYKTGVVFAAFVPALGKEIARGGRYDDIGRCFGRSRPATGFSADLKVLANLGTSAETIDTGSVFAPASADDSLRTFIDDLRRSGRRVIRELPGQTAAPKEMNCSFEIKGGPGQWRIVPIG